jgi:2-keto-3-deoxy-L-rhamnonate aldolase RhmA
MVDETIIENLTMESTLLEKLKNGGNVYGTCITSTGPMWPAAVKRTGVDFVFIDTEHIPLGRTEMATLCQQFRHLGITPIVRIPCPDPYLACQAIDAGAKGIVAPYLESTAQITELVGATKYRPLKGEVLQNYLSGAVPMPENMREYVAKYNAGNICIANIESVPAMDNLDALLSVPGLDAVFIGPHDLSVSLGLPEQYDHPDFEKAVSFIIRTTRAKGLAIGIHFSLEPERQIQWMKEGANIVVHSFDVALFVQKLNADLDKIKKGIGDVSTAMNDSAMVV